MEHEKKVAQDLVYKNNLCAMKSISQHFHTPTIEKMLADKRGERQKGEVINTGQQWQQNEGTTSRDAQ